MLNNDRGTPNRRTAGTGRSAQAPAAPRVGPGWVRNWRLRWKMAAVLLVPTLAALAVGGIRVYDGLATANQLNTLVEEVALTQRTADLVQEMQRERDYAVVKTSAPTPDNTDQYNTQSVRVDQAVSKMLQSAAPWVYHFNPGVRDAYQAAVNRLSRLSALRDVVNTGFTPSQSLVAYSSTIDSLVLIDTKVAAAAANTELTQTARATESISRAKEYLAQQRSILLSVGMRGQFLPGQSDEIRMAEAQYKAAITEFNRAATDEQRALFTARVAGPEVDTAERIKQYALIAADQYGASIGIDPEEWGREAGGEVDLVRGVEQQLLEDFHNSAESYAQSTQLAVARDAGAVLLLLIVAFAVAALIARSMLRPLRTLRFSALQIAQESLPAAIDRVNENPASAESVTVPPVPVHTREEIGEVARAFDGVHQQALRLASEQALLRTNVNDLFVNLARRSQTLVQRQLALIDRLEQDEQDPDQLSSLFELDHLATRMRRNNENLLILGGTDLTRRMMRPVPLDEVLGAAVSEVEQYKRIAVASTPELAIQGRVVNDFVHLVAELLENATVFSNPDTEVTVRTAYRRQELVVEIRDRGVGIDSEDLDEINERLTNPPQIDVSVSRRMGLYVVGQLARRHNIRVRMHNNTDLEGGATATVHLSGEFASQMTPDGPKPMPDVPRTAPRDESRDSVADTGKHLGLAAAFGRGGVTDRAGEPPTEGTPLPSLNGSGDSTGVPEASERTPSSFSGPELTGRLPEAFNGRPELSVGTPISPPLSDDIASTPLPRREKPSEQPDTMDETKYSLRFRSGDSLGATDIPRWDSDTQIPAVSEDSAQQWPSEHDASAKEVTETFDAQYGASSLLKEPADLFNSPFEAEKTPLPGVGPDSLSADSGAGPHRRDQAADDPIPWDDDDAPTQRLPIYEAVLSQWFRESDMDSPIGSSLDSPLGNGESTTTTHSEPESEPAPEENTASKPDTPQDVGWGTADEGWQAAEALVQLSQQPHQTTPAGLPKRVPKSNLVPGSASPRSAAPAVSRKPATPRSAEAVRGRMSNFQQGIRRGRHARAEPVSIEPPRSNPSRHEEQE